MDQEKIQNLIVKFNTQQLNAEEQMELEQLIESGVLDLQALDTINVLNDKLNKINFPEPSKELDDRFYQMLALEKGNRKSFAWQNIFSWSALGPKLAFASITLLVGLALGHFIRPAQVNDTQIVALSEQVTDLKEMMMLSLLEKESATERLRAVSLTQDMSGVSSKVTSALIQTLNQDDNVNVRLAALEALKPYTKDGAVREGLIRAIAMQNSPLVQMALAELMAEIQEKSSVKELQKIIQSERTPAEIKNRIKESIKILS